MNQERHLERKSPLRDLWKQFTSLWYAVVRHGPINGIKGLLELWWRALTGAPPPWFSQVSPNLYVSGQYQERGLPRMLRRGVTAVVNMRDEYDDKAAGIAPDNYLHLKVVDNTAPELDQLRSGIKFIQDQIEDGGKVYIHCAAGVGRAPTMAAAYLVNSGMTPEEAWKRIRRARPFISPVAAQVAQIELLAKELAETKAQLDAASAAADDVPPPVPAVLHEQTGEVQPPTEN